MSKQRRKVPWDDIKLDYIRGSDDGSGHRVYPTQRDLAAKYQIDPASIGRRASKEQWAVQREQFASRVSTLSQQKLAEQISDESCDLNLKIYNIASALADRIESVALDVKEPQKLNQLSTALKNVQSITASSLGDKTAESEALEIQVKLEAADEG